MFSQLVAAIYNYMAHLTAFTRTYAPNWQVSKTKRKLLQRDFEFSSVITIQQVFIKQHVQYNIHITASCYFWYFEILGERSILLNVFLVVSDVFVQQIPYQKLTYYHHLLTN